MISVEEKAKNPKSSYAIAGLYFYPSDVSNLAEQVVPSECSELVITLLNEMYLNQRKLDVQLLGRCYAWLDTGTVDSLVKLDYFVKMIREHQGIKISAPEEIAFRIG